MDDYGYLGMSQLTRNKIKEALCIFTYSIIKKGEDLFLQRDYQGSTLAISDASGAVVEKRLFDAWGNVVKVQNGAVASLAGQTLLERVYMGHEHLQSVGIININGRIYDPKLHRFLQPDENIQDPFSIQNHNRYGYVL